MIDGVPGGTIGMSTTADAPQAPIRNWPSAPMFHRRIRKARAQARPVRISGVAMTSVSDRTPRLPKDERRMWTKIWMGSPPAIHRMTVSYTHLRAHETRHDLVCRLLLEKKKKK